uniref:Uncharacterized protein n=1 Tax=Hordeum vulgare subsp. vulgare TaxID=112509 RepID=A0A8I6XA53_HORVV
MSRTKHQSTILLQREATGLGQVEGAATHSDQASMSQSRPLLLFLTERRNTKGDHVYFSKAQCIPPKACPHLHDESALLSLPPSLVFSWWQCGIHDRSNLKSIIYFPHIFTTLIGL